MHYVMGVIFDSSGKSVPGWEEAQQRVQGLLDPFSEHMEVPVYPTDCYCLSQEARVHAATASEAEFGSYKESWKKFEARPDVTAIRVEQKKVNNILYAGKKGKAFWRSPAGKDLLEAQSKWFDAYVKLREEFIQPKVDFAKKAEQAHPLYMKPGADCEECDGTGSRMTTCNPDGHLDWWVIGGRWAGQYAPEYDPSEDQQNRSPCDLCAKTGKRKWFALENPEKDDLLDFDRKFLPLPVTAEKMVQYEEKGGEIVERDCNGCEGTGTKRNFSNCDFYGDVLTVHEVLKVIDAGDAEYPWRLVTPDGTWHEIGGGPGGGNSKEHLDEWRIHVRKVMEKYAHMTYAVVDFHS